MLDWNPIFKWYQFFSVRLEDLGIDDLTKGTLYPQVRTNSLALFGFHLIRLIQRNVDVMITSVLHEFAAKLILICYFFQFATLFFVCDGSTSCDHTLT